MPIILRVGCAVAAAGQAYVMLSEIHRGRPLMALLAGTIAVLMAIVATAEVVEK
jgi:hypothetical protein